MITAAWLLAGTLASASAPVFEDCVLRGPSNLRRVHAECASLEVAENPAVPDGRRIALRIARVPALSTHDARAPLVMLAGGPGQAATEAFIPLIGTLGPLRQRHELILIDQRGTGGSAPLTCPDASADAPYPETAREAEEWAVRCLAELAGDPRHYTTSVAVDDLERVREALGIERWHVYGVSYGSRVALAYLRRHPEAIDRVILDGVVPADEILGPMLGPFAQQALEQMLQRCASDPECDEAFPDLEDSFERLMRSLENSPREVALRHPSHGGKVRTWLDRTRVAQVVRMASYQPQMLALLPLIIDRAARGGDWEPMAAQWLLLESMMEGMMTIGMHNAVICSEDMSFLTAGMLPEEPGYLGTNPIDLLEAMCAVWPAGEVPEDFHQPVRSERPTLLLSGELDPVTPPAWGEQAARTLINSRHLVVPGKGHNVLGSACLPWLARDFLRGDDPAELDAECLEKARPTPFFLDFSGPRP
jgi:pimeloyl-ACP methyl ester carboxylesterase